MFVVVVVSVDVDDVTLNLVAVVAVAALKLPFCSQIINLKKQQQIIGVSSLKMPSGTNNVL